MKINELREALLKKGMNLEQTVGLSKKELEDLLSTYTVAENAFSNVNVEETQAVDIDTPILEEIPKFCSPEWNNYVMRQFQLDELENGMPRVDALRRVCFLLSDGGVEMRTEVIQTPNLDNNDRATVIVHLQTGSIKVSGAADVFVGNTDKKFAIHAVATAETRAEGRAIRKALGLTKVLAAEEMHNAELDEPNGTDNRIVSSMLNGLKIMCDRVKVDLLRLSKHMEFDINTPEDLTKEQGLKISNKLSLYQNNKEEIPESVRV